MRKNSKGKRVLKLLGIDNIVRLNKRHLDDLRRIK